MLPTLSRAALIAAITPILGAIGIVCGLTFLAARRVGGTGLAVAKPVVVLMFAVGAVGADAALARADAGSVPLTADELLRMPDGLIEEIQSAYNNIFVRKSGTRVKMSFRRYGNDYTESVRDLLDKDDLVVPYTRLMTTGVAISEQARSLLMIGLGGGSTSSYLARHMPGLEIDVIELDPGVIAAARRYFGIRESARYRVHQSDGRVYLRRSKRLYDMIMVDAFRGGYVPFHLLTQEFYRLVAKRLADGGVAVFNVHGGTRLFRATVETLRTVFPTIAGFSQARSSGNVVIVASLQQIDWQEVLARAQELQRAHRFRYGLPGLMRQSVDLGQVSDDTVLTDDFAPVNLYKAIRDKNARKW